MRMASRPHIFTIGHSTHPIERFLALLKGREVQALIDVRSYPGSRRWPQFNQAELFHSLESSGIEYRWMKDLGGRRHGKREDSPHIGWTHPAFRSYSDHTETAEFAAALQELCDLAARKVTACMCSEGLWWKCHRRIISDYLVVRGWQVSRSWNGRQNSRSGVGARS